MTETDIAKQLGATIAKKRRSLGLTQAQLAEKLDIGQDALSRMEKGRISPKLTRLPYIAAALDCSVAELFRPQNEGNEDIAAQIAAIIEPLSKIKQYGLMETLPKLVSLIQKP